MTDELKVPVWVKQGDMLIRRDCLHHDDPDHTYNYVKTILGVVPEEYGIEHPLVEEYGHLTKSQLISRISELEKEIESLICHGF